MRLGYSKSKNAISYYVYKTGYKNGKNTTVMVEKLGTDSQIREKYGVEDAESGGGLLHAVAGNDFQCVHSSFLLSFQMFLPGNPCRQRTIRFNVVAFAWH